MDKVCIVLVGTSHPGNIGAVARAMKTMDLQHLVLVRPKLFPSAEATARATGADDILERARVCDSLPEALRDMQRAFATTARERHLEWPQYTPRSFAESLSTETDAGPVAVVFGCENSGLANQDIEWCQGVIRIPTSERFRSLNLGMAVQVIAYELFMADKGAVSQTQQAEDGSDPSATLAEIEQLRRHWLDVMAELGLYDVAKPKLLARRLSRLLAKTRLKRSEAQILRGFLTAVKERL
jgi:TrmH family RNA methyltransferase